MPSADVLIMGHILHDWGLDKKRMLVRKAYEALPLGGALIVYDPLIDDDRRHNTFGLLMSLNMLIRPREASTSRPPTARPGSDRRASATPTSSISPRTDSMIVAIDRRARPAISALRILRMCMIDITRAAHEAGTVRKAKPDELGRLAAVLARAFYDDPPIRWVITDDGRRRKLFERSFGLYLRRLWFKQDACYTTDSVVGATSGSCRGNGRSGSSQLAPAALDGADQRPAASADPARARRAGVESSVEPHYYLPLVGVEPEWQGRGLGTALMRPIVERCDGEKVPAYLEATTPRNRALYGATASR